MPLRFARRRRRAPAQEELSLGENTNPTRGRSTDAYTWDLSTWRWQQRLSASALPQALACALGDGASGLVWRYIPSLDVVVAAAHAYTPRRRVREDARGATAANARALPTLAAWRRGGATRAPAPHVLFEAPSRRVVPSRLGFPSDDGIICVGGGSAAGGGGHHVTVVKDGHVFGLRRAEGAAAAAAAAAPAREESKAASPPPPAGGSSLPWEFIASFAAVAGCAAGGALPEARLAISSGPPGTVRRGGAGGGARAGTVIATAACAGGLVVEVCSGGWVRQRYPDGSGGGGAAEAGEEWRTVTGAGGTVVRAQRDGRRQVLAADGSTAWYVPSAGGGGGGVWHATAPSGVRSVTGAAPAPLEVHTAVDAASGARVRVRVDEEPELGATPAGLLSARTGEKRTSPRAIATPGGAAGGGGDGRSVRTTRSVDEAFTAAAAAYAAARETLDGGVWTGAGGGGGDRTSSGGGSGRVVIVDYPNGDRLALFGCGLHIASFAPRGDVPRGGTGVRVVVAAPGFAPVELDSDIERQSRQHAGGGIARVVRRGNCTRSVTSLPDGTLLAVDYDTRVTVPVNGRLRLHRPDGVVITALDNGVIEVRPAASAALAAGTLGVGDVFGETDAGVAGADAAGEGSDGDGRATPRSVRSVEDVSAGAYGFDCGSGRLEVVDAERNAFVADAGRCTLDVDLAGTVPGSDVVPAVTAARPPRLFVLDGSGGGVELLHPGAWARIVGGATPTDAGLGGAVEAVVSLSTGALSVTLETGRTGDGDAAAGAGSGAPYLDPAKVPTLPRTLSLPPGAVVDGDEGGPAALRVFVTPLYGAGLREGRRGALVRSCAGAWQRAVAPFVCCDV